MGLTRKMLSVTTLGAVDFRSDKERAARHTSGTKRAAKKTARQAKKQTRLLEEQTRLLRQAAKVK